MKKVQKLLGFTLVELIVVITILAVLGTISFISLGGYSRDARDSKRIADLNSIRKVLEYNHLKEGYYILPENGVNVTYNNGVSSKAVWQQGIFGEESKKELGTNNGLSNVPRDPLTNTYYTYSVLNTKKEIQLGAVLEGGISSNLQTTYAAGNNIGRSHIIGNYNGKIAKVSIGTNLYIFAVPSIISTDLTRPDILSLLSNNKLAFNGTTKLPSSYDKTDYNLDGDGNDLIINNVTQPIFTTSQGDTIDGSTLITNLQDAYAGTTVSNDSRISEVLSLDSSDTDSYDSFIEESVEEFIAISETPLPETTGNTGTGNPELDLALNDNGGDTGGTGNTVTCLERTPGDTFVQGGVTYLVVSDRQSIVDNMANINSTYNLCTSHSTDMSFLLVDPNTGEAYSYGLTFNEDISSWDTSSVTNMIGTFASMSLNSFNQDISSWDISLVGNEKPEYFDYNAGFEGNDSLQPWIAPEALMVGNTVTCNGFQDGDTFELNGTTYRVVDRYSIDDNLDYINSTQNLCTTNVTRMYGLFRDNTTFNEDISSWDTSNVTSMSYMFDGASSFDQDISGWDVSNVTSINGMFDGASSFNQDISNLNFDQVDYMPYNFETGTLIYGDASKIPSFTTGYMDGNIVKCDNISNITYAFYLNGNRYRIASGYLSSYYVDGISKLCTSQVTSMSTLFNGNADFNEDISDWDVSGVTSMSNMFQGATSFNQDISGWDTSGITNMAAMFNGATSFNQDISAWDVSNIPYMPSFFDYGSGLDGYPEKLPNWPNGALNANGVTVTCDGFPNHSAFYLDGVRYFVYTSKNALSSRLQYIDSSHNVCTTALTDMNDLFRDNTTFNEDINSWDVSNVERMANMFQGATSFNQDISAWDVSKVFLMTSMFYNATNFNQDISSWNISTSIPYMPVFFEYGSGLHGQPEKLPNWPTGTLHVNGVTVTCDGFSDYSAFYLNGKRYINVSNSNMVNNSSYYLNFIDSNNNLCTTLVDEMDNLFENNTGTIPDITSWDISGVLSMNSMFKGATNFNQDISEWDTSNVRNIISMFEGATNFNQDISGWNYSSHVTSFGNLFKGATSFNQDLSGWWTNSIGYCVDYDLGATSWIENYKPIFVQSCE